MHDPRNSTALRQLADLGDDPEPPHWAWAVVRPDPAGRLCLPIEARGTLGVEPGRRHELRGICHRVALVLRADGAGAPIVVDGRGRLSLPTWLRRRTGGSLVVGTDRATAMLVIAPVAVLDGLGGILAGGSR
jgi:bifunctional DNA-binding transcriptional regulator/antitoxin component of YhaV-PrlF toxin-antitoxin module